MSNPPSHNEIPSTMAAIKCDICQRVFDAQNPPFVENNFRFCADCHQKMREKYGPFESDGPPIPKIKPSTIFILFGILLLVIGYLILGIAFWQSITAGIIIGGILANIGWFLFAIGVLIKVISQGIREVNNN